MTINIEALLRQAEVTQEKEHDEKEAGKTGILRGGNAGNLTITGDINGGCHRIALARSLGFDTPNDDRSVHFFSAGRANEDRWVELLKRSWHGVVLQEEECPVLWSVVSQGGREVPVTGRPDVVLCDADRVPQVGVELKKVCSSYRAVAVFIKHAPDSKHLVQAAFYSWRLGRLPWILSYTSDSSYDTPYWAQKKFGAGAKIAPGREHYYLVWQGDQLCYVDPVSARLVPTSITGAGIQRFYELVASMSEDKDLGPRPSYEHVSGDGTDYDACKTCAFKSACDRADRGETYDDWLARVQQICEGGGDDA